MGMGDVRQKLKTATHLRRRLLSFVPPPAARRPPPYFLFDAELLDLCVTFFFE